MNTYYGTVDIGGTKIMAGITDSEGCIKKLGEFSYAGTGGLTDDGSTDCFFKSNNVPSFYWIFFFKGNRHRMCRTGRSAEGND